MQNLPLILISAILVVFVLPVRWKGVLALILVAAGVGITSVAVYPVLLSGETLHRSFDISGDAGITTTGH
jgi:hypothetical protein